MQPSNSSNSSDVPQATDVVVTDPAASTPSASSGTGLSSWPELKQLNAAVTVTPMDGDAQLRNRKRQRPSAPSSPSAGSFPTPGDLKLDFAGFEVGGSASTAVMASAPLTVATSSPAMTYPAASGGYGATAGSYSSGVSTDDVLTFLKNLQLAQDSAALSLATQRLAQDGFDSVLALAFAAVSELQRAGIADAQLVWQQARRDFQARRFQGPGVFSPTYTVSRWLELCGIPKSSTFEYAEYLCRLGYSSVRDLEFVVHDQRALAVFKIGHSRLVVHCVTAAANQQQQQQQQLQVANYQYGSHGPNVYTAGSSSALLQPLDIQRENEFDVQAYDSFLEALIEPTDAERIQQQRYSAPALTLGRENDPNRINLMGAADVFGNRMSFGGVSAVASPVPSNMPLRLLPQEHLQLLYEAVNLPRPNACRRGKKIYWSVLATGGMKEDRFAPLTQFTAAELQNAYLRQFELPASNPVKMDAWSDENIRQLEHAVKDPRCRHLSKVCWEMLATGRTGVEEYAPLSKFTASQLRSRFRSLFGDKRPQKLRQKKQMLKLQQQQQQQQEQQQANSAAMKNERSI
ncbi:uncharacterized protein IUM83_05944 [Phytophthora cinnamomi]|uniref:uncharacterized protein n=1 Tax=Phytophthora cinnamomi TaxID=4785 RepID=UPI00355A2234|nr:hypothetical protein IUM83_05944 [Phytophthora cinnamomi]